MRSVPRLCCITCLVACLGLPGCTTGWHATSEDHQLQAKSPEFDDAAKVHTDKQSRNLKATRMTEWNCEIPDSRQVELIGSIDNYKQLRQVWDVCHPDVPLPEVDFEKNVICLEFWDAADLNGHGCDFYRKPDGSIQSEAISTAVYYEPSDNTKIEFYVVSRN
jgi:hypothetical protein